MNHEDLLKLKQLIDSGGIDTLSTQELNELLENIYTSQKRSFKDYIPHTKQKLFHISEAKTRVLLGGNRSGKSFAGIEEDLWHLTGEYPDWYPKHLRLETPVFGRYIATDFKKGVGGVLQPYIEELVSSNYIKRIQKTQQGIIEKIFFTNGSQFDIMTHEQDVDVFEGWHGHFAHFDEPPPRDRYIATIRGLIDFGGRCWFTLTPLKEAWIYDELYLKADGKRIFAITVDMLDNPHISKDEKDEFISHLSEDEKEARCHGKFTHLSGSIYKNFNREVHVVDNFEIPQDWKRIQVLDPHDRKPHALIWAAVDPFDRLYIYNDAEVGGTVAELSEYIKRIEDWTNPNPLLRFKSHLRIIDPNKGRAPSEVGKKGLLVDEFRKNGLEYIYNVNDNLDDGHLVVRDYLSYNKTKPVDINNSPRLYIFKSCLHTINGMTHYVYDDHRNTDGKSLKEKPRDLYKDFPDCVRYLCILKPKYFQENPFVKSRERNTTGY